VRFGWLFVLLTAFSAAPAQTTPPASSTPSTAPGSALPAQSDQTKPSADQSPEALARQYVELWNTGNVESVKANYRGFYMTSHGHRVMADYGMLSRVISFWRKSMPDLNLKIEDTVVQGDKVAMRLSVTGTYKAILFPMTVTPSPTDPPRKIRATEMLFFHVQDGKIAEIWEEYDEMVMRVQMGGQWSSDLKSSKATPTDKAPAVSP